MVVDSVADELVRLLKEGVAKLSVGRPEDDCDICHVISTSSADWIEKLVTGARLSVLWAARRACIHCTYMRKPSQRNNRKRRRVAADKNAGRS